MNRTVTAIVGIVVTVVALILIFSSVEKLLREQGDSSGIMDVHVSHDGENLSISWRTEGMTDGLVSYSNSTASSQVKDYDLSDVHSVTFGVSGSVEYNITSCSIEGFCSTEQGNITV